MNTTGVRVKVLRVASRGVSGRALDKVKVSVELLVDSAGNYYAKAQVVNGEPLLYGIRPHKIATKAVTLTAPHPVTYKEHFTQGGLAVVTPSDTEAHAHLIIDAE